MAVRTDALQIIDPCQEIIKAEDLKTQFQASGGVVFVNSGPDSQLTPMQIIELAARAPIAGGGGS